MEYLRKSASCGLAEKTVTSCLSCRWWTGRCRWRNVARVMKWRRGRVSDESGVVWHFGAFDGTPEKMCPKYWRENG